jgi:hypothetical protein
LKTNAQPYSDTVFVAVGPPELCYKLVGECYVDGYMDGEAIDLGKEGETFKLV